MAKQADLFTFDDDAEQTYPQTPGYVRDSDTSRAAADSFDESDLSRQKQLIMGCYHARRSGLTATRSRSRSVFATRPQARAFGNWCSLVFLSIPGAVDRREVDDLHVFTRRKSNDHQPRQAGMRRA
jgi:hypothetical protein